MNKSKVYIDLRMLNNSGIGTYLKNLMPIIIKNNNTHTFYLMGDKRELLNYEWTNNNKVSLIDFNSKIYSISEQKIYQKLTKNSNVLWCPHFNVPLYLNKNSKLVTTIHDVFHLANPQYVGGVHKRMFAKTLFNAAVKNSSAVLCVSDFTKKEINKHLNVRNTPIFPVYNGVNSSWFNIKEGSPVHSKPFLLYVGNVKPHKNLVRLVKGFSKISNEIPHDLIIIGQKEGFITGDNEIFEITQKLNDRVIFTGKVSDEKLQQYFIHAECLVFPSLYEGFGLPPLEAMACGCPVISSNVASLPEVCGDAALYCDPYDIDDIANKIKSMVTNKELRDMFRYKGLERAKQFTWEKCAKETWAVIEEVLSQ